MQSFSYLFPYEKIRQGSKVLIYGAGNVGIEYYSQLQMNGYCEVVGFIDRNYEEKKLGIGVYPPDEINNLEFDFIVIAMKTDRNIREIFQILSEQNIPQEKIVKTELYEVFIEGASLPDETFAFEITEQSMMIEYHGGIGDLISHKAFIDTMIKEIPEMKIDLFGVTNVKFVEYLFSDTDNINIISALNGRPKEYGIAFNGFPRYVNVQNFKKENFKDYPDFIRKIENLISYNVENPFSYQIPIYVWMQRYLYLGKNYYSAQDLTGELGVATHVNVPLTETGKQNFEKLGLGKYITICTGNGISGGHTVISKAWPVDSFEKLAAELKHKYKDVEIVQIDAANQVQLKNVDRCFLGESYETVAWILKNTILLISIEGGMVHMASQLGTKCAVLFGATSVDYVGYEGNINICTNCCDPCYGIYNDTYKCAREMDEPECMYSITPMMVINRISEYLSM